MSTCEWFSKFACDTLSQISLIYLQFGLHPYSHVMKYQRMSILLRDSNQFIFESKERTLRLLVFCTKKMPTRIVLNFSCFYHWKLQRLNLNMGRKFTISSIRQEHLAEWILFAWISAIAKGKKFPFYPLPNSLSTLSRMIYFTWKRLSRPCFALPPAESPSTMKISGSIGNRCQ